VATRPSRGRHSTQTKTHKKKLFFGFSNGTGGKKWQWNLKKIWLCGTTKKKFRESCDLI
jgi:hypothetical protein